MSARTWPPIVLVGCLLTGCGRASPPAPARPAREAIRVAAASDLRDALPALAADFTAATGIEVVPVFGASGQLAQQIRQGAPYDVFLSANVAYVRDLAKAGHVEADSARVYARGRLVLAVGERPGAMIAGLSDLTRPEVKRVAIANPEFAPYGLAARQALERSGLWQALEPKVVQAETVRQALQFVQTGNAEAGLVAHSVARAAGLRSIEVDPGLHDPILQGLGVLAGSEHPEAARRFSRFLLGDQGRRRLAAFGFGTPPDGPGQ